MSQKKDHVWDLGPLFSGPTDPKIQQEREAVREWVEAFEKKYRTDDSYLTDEKTLFEAYQSLEEFVKNNGQFGKFSFYIGLASSLDTANPELKHLSAEQEQFISEMSVRIEFFELKLGKIPAEIQKKFLSSDLLKPYHYSLNRLFDSAKYDLSEAEEKIITQLTPFAFTNWVELREELYSNEVRTFKKEKKNLSQLFALTQSHDKKERDLAGKLVNDILTQYSTVAEKELNSVLGYQSLLVKLRGAKRCDTFRLNEDDVNPSIVDALMVAVENYRHVSHRYFEAKAKLLGQRKLEQYERSYDFPISNALEIPFDEGLALVKRVFRRLDPEFETILDEMIQNKQIDVYPRKGKRGGGFCAGNTTVDPVYILINYMNRMQDVSTLAHEMGHAMNDVFMQRAGVGDFAYGTSLATAEVASTFFEDFISEEITKELPKDQRKFVLMNKLNDDVAAIFRQVACYRFEQDIATEYEKTKFLPKERMSEIFQKRMESYMGPYVSQKKGGGLFWMDWGHIRTSFYVYSYASGQLISKALQRMVRKDRTKIVLVKEFLSTGRVMSPENIFKKLGIDITQPEFWEEGLKEIEETLKAVEALI